MDRLELNIADVDDKEAFLTVLQNVLIVTGATANGIFRKDVDPESGEDKGTVQIVNNVPALPGKGVKYGVYDLVFY